MREPAISIQDVQFAWPGSQSFSLRIPQLSVETGERILLLGPSGTGKSTLLSLMCGVLVADGGSLRVLDTELKTLSSAKRDRFRAEHIGVVFQQFNLLPYGSVLDNILLPLSFAPMRRERASRAWPLEQEANRLLAALDLQIDAADRQAVDLSVGQQQRVAVARALIGSPEIVIADEPTSALDGETQSQFLDLMFAQLAETDATLIMVSHDERLTGRFDRVISLPELLTAAPIQQEKLA